MDEIIPNLWIGDISSAVDKDRLLEHRIYNVVSAMRGRVTLHDAFKQHLINIDDTDEEDILVHFLPSIAFIQAELDRNRGVLVHCQAGISRSATIVAAYLMYTQQIDCEAALELIRKARPRIEPNAGFMLQLEIFHQASYKISHHDKTTRMFYLERTLGEVMNGDGSMPGTNMFAKFPPTPPSGSVPPSPGAVRRKIRCKMCRHELATREHMLDHGQLGPPTPAVAFSPAGSRRVSMSDQRTASRRPSATITVSRRPSVNGSKGGAQPPLSMEDLGRGLSESLSASALDTDDEDDHSEGKIQSGSNRPFRPSPLNEKSAEDEADPAQTAHPEPLEPLSVSAVPPHPPPSSRPLSSPSELATQLHSHPNLAGLRSQMLISQVQSINQPTSPPILANPKCSGYFVEPMKWMESFLEGGQMAGKIVCPNKKCGAKLGNYDWAGVCCGCKEWVTPGFCINRSKVDEVV